MCVNRTPAPGVGLDAIFAADRRVLGVNRVDVLVVRHVRLLPALTIRHDALESLAGRLTRTRPRVHHPPPGDFEQETAMGRRAQTIGLLTGIVLAASAARAQVDLTGSWGPRYHEDFPERIPGPDLANFLGLPITEGARQWAL